MAAIVHESEDTPYDSQYPEYNTNEFCRIHIIKTRLTTATTADPPKRTEDKVMKNFIPF
ncbi:hypothetical protein KU664_12215 [Klebsiella variicola]|nr:hypothetical protein KU664_12215 [Klebsiella variicola]